MAASSTGRVTGGALADGDYDTLRHWCELFIREQRIRSSESVYQMDNVIENAYDFIAGVCTLVGYYEDGEDHGSE